MTIPLRSADIPSEASAQHGCHKNLQKFLDYRLGKYVTVGRLAAFAAMGMALSGCGTITQGPTQSIAFTSNPPGAECHLWENTNWHIATLTTPMTITVRKTKYDLEVVCSKQGYKDGTVTLISGYGLGVFGNAIIGGATGWAIDSATGSDNKYPSVANVTLMPITAGSTASVATLNPSEK
jgi:hypothetical protein